MQRTLVFIAAFMCGACSLDAARIVSVAGSPEIVAQSTGGWVASAAHDGMTVGAGARIRCGGSSSVALMTDSGHRIRVFPRTEVALNAIDGPATTLELVTGRLRSWVKRLKTRGGFQVRTPVAVCSVRGTDFAVEYGADRQTKVEVYEGSVAAREERTGAEVTVRAGNFVQIAENQAPSPPQALPNDEGQPAPAAAVVDQTRAEARAEIFQELSREAVLARSADEIKLAEYQNGKALIDASGSRVRLEEYIVRTAPNEFKYVVLNTRKDRFDFGKMVFTFNADLPQDLTLATRTMFHADTPTRPEWWLTDVLTVMSNTIDQVNEEAHGGQMFVDDPSYPSSWSLGFRTYAFSVNGKTWWDFIDANANGTLDAGEISYYNATTGAKLNFSTDFSYDSASGKYYLPRADGGRDYFNEFSQPDGPDAFHFLQKNTYADGQWIAAEDYIISDDGKTIDLGALRDLSSAALEQKAYASNFERVYTCSAFQGRKIDLVFSAKLLMDAGILSLPDLSR